MSEINEQLILISGESGSGKSASLRNIPNQERWAYFNCEAGKRLPFRNKFQEAKVTDPYQIWSTMTDMMSEIQNWDGMIIDTATFMMDMFESVHVIGSTNSQKAWGDYAQFFKNLMQDYVVRFQKPVIVLGHTRQDLDETSGTWRTAVPIKGSLKGNGIEAYFSTVVSTKKVTIKELEKYNSNLLTVTEEDRNLGFKYVFQTRLTKTTVGERIRAPMGMFTESQTYMDNDVWKLLQHLHEYYHG